MKEFFERLGTPPARPDLVEKDYYLHRLLEAISSDDHLSEDLVFKGGTCLIKAYLGYYRFSDDLDFTWRSDALWKGRSRGMTARLCSVEIGRILRAVEKAADGLGMQFQGDKRAKGEVHISSGGRMVTLFLGYRSEVLGTPTTVKVETNMVDTLLFPIREVTLKSYVAQTWLDDLKFLFPEETKNYRTPLKLSCYDPREIFVEKCRAILTRRGFKVRDVVDLYYMNKELGFSVHSLAAAVKKKVKFMADLYRRYDQNLMLAEMPSSRDIAGEELKLLLDRVPQDMPSRIEVLIEDLDSIREDILSSRRRRRPSRQR